jgi:hypothetical protein
MVLIGRTVSPRFRAASLEARAVAPMFGGSVLDVRGAALPICDALLMI